MRRLINSLRTRFGLEQVLHLLILLQSQESLSSRDKGAQGDEDDGDLAGQQGASGRKQKKLKRGLGGEANKSNATSLAASSKHPDNDGVNKAAHRSGAGAGADKHHQDAAFAKKLGVFTSSVRDFVGADGRLLLEKLFGNQHPVKLEIAAGAGEWAAAQVKRSIKTQSCKHPSTLPLHSTCTALS